MAKEKKEKKADTINQEIPDEAAAESNDTKKTKKESKADCNEQITALSAEIEKLKNELSAQKDALMRTAAEYANFRSRTEREKASIYTNATADAVKNILPIADSMDMALKSIQDAPEEYKKGIELIRVQLEKSFKALNIEAFGEAGEEFNPDLHNAVAHIESEDFGENVVAQVFQRGYKCGDKIIRHCMVQVAN